MWLRLSLFTVLLVASTNGITSKLRGQTLSVVTLEQPPFVFKDHNDRFAGYLIDLWKRIEELLDFNTNMYVVPDGKYGSKNETTGQWSGLVGELMSGSADVALAPLTVSSERMDVIQFSSSFMPAGIVALTLRPGAGKPVRYADLLDLATQPDTRYTTIKHGSTYAMFTNSDYPLYREIGRRLLSAEGQRHLATNMSDGVRKLRTGDAHVFLAEQMFAEYLVSRKPCDLYVVGRPIQPREYALGVSATKEHLAAELSKAIVRIKFHGEEEKIRRIWWENECRRPLMCVCEENVSSGEMSTETYDDDQPCRDDRRKYNNGGNRNRGDVERERSREEKRRQQYQAARLRQSTTTEAPSSEQQSAQDSEQTDDELNSDEMTSTTTTEEPTTTTPEESSTSPTTTEEASTTTTESTTTEEYVYTYDEDTTTTPTTTTTTEQYASSEQIAENRSDQSEQDSKDATESDESSESDQKSERKEENRNDEINESTKSQSTEESHESSESDQNSRAVYDRDGNRILCVRCASSSSSSSSSSSESEQETDDKQTQTDRGTERTN